MPAYSLAAVSLAAEASESSCAVRSNGGSPERHAASLGGPGTEGNGGRIGLLAVPVPCIPSSTPFIFGPSSVFGTVETGVGSAGVGIIGTALAPLGGIVGWTAVARPFGRRLGSCAGDGSVGRIAGACPKSNVLLSSPFLPLGTKRRERERSRFMPGLALASCMRASDPISASSGGTKPFIKGSDTEATSSLARAGSPWVSGAAAGGIGWIGTALGVVDPNAPGIDADQGVVPPFCGSVSKACIASSLAMFFSNSFTSTARTPAVQVKGPFCDGVAQIYKHSCCVRKSLLGPHKCQRQQCVFQHTGHDSCDSAAPPKSPGNFLAGASRDTIYESVGVYLATVRTAVAGLERHSIEKKVDGIKQVSSRETRRLGSRLGSNRQVLCNGL